ncbi:YoaK family protein [Ensifer soli]|uniref:YoaK family protein n=1 Tax=Ciceribacter sp. sgz301302 TaxID=3342379 RepID=UPI0035B78CCB
MTHARRRRLVERRRKALGLVLVAVLSFLAGMTDALGLLIGGNFVSFMSGNTTRAAVAAAGGDGAAALLLAGALLVFVAGNTLGIVIAHGAERRLLRVMIGVALLLAGAAAIPPGTAPEARFYLLVLAMGVVNVAVEQVEGLPVGLTFVTGALSRFGKGLGGWLTGERRADWLMNSAPWLGMAAGALSGATIGHLIGPGPGLWFATAIATLLAVASLFVPPHMQRRLANARPRRATLRLRSPHP